jgi:hypothetical protein
MSSQRTEKVVLFFDSGHRSTGTIDSYTITLDNPIDRVTGAEIISAEIPYTFYTVNTSNNTLLLSDGTNNYTYTMPVGNYSVSNFSDTLTSGLDTQFAANGIAAGFSATFSQMSYEYTLMHKTQQFQLFYQGSTLAPVIGLTADSVLGTTFTMQEVINLSGPNYLLIWSKTLAKPKRIRPYLNGTQANILYKCPVNVNPGDIIIEKNLYPNMLEYGTPQRLVTIDLSLTDPQGNPVNLNGQQWSCTVNIEKT